MPLSTPGLRPLDRDEGQAGILAPTSQWWVGAQATLVAQEADLARFVPSRNMTILSIGFYVTTTAGANDNYDVGIYTVSGGNYSRLVSSGATAGKLNVGGLQSIPITATNLTAGTIYYAAGLCGALGGTAGKLLGASYARAELLKMWGTNAGMIDTDFKSSAGTTLPSTITGAGGNTLAPIFTLNET